MEHAVILAGGSGTRLWPLSRRRRPKQLLPLIEGRSLLTLALDRLGAVFPPDRTWIVTQDELVEPVRAAAVSLPAENVLGEPAVRDTSNAIGLACRLLADRDDDARVAVFSADHVIRPADRFAAAVRDALDLVDDQPEAIVLFGVLPAWPHAGLGYVRRGECVGPKLFRADQFVEKPDAPAAREYVVSGQYYWNSGMFVWRARTLLDRLARFRPDHAALLERAAGAYARGDRRAAANAYADLPRISIDHALLEPAARAGDCPILVRELDCQWLDVGTWSVLAEVSALDESNNLRIGRVAALDASGNILVSNQPGHLLAVIGLEDMVVVHSGDATLVTPKARAQDVKKLLDEVAGQFGQDYE